MAAGNANILIEIGANLLYSIVAQTAPGVPMNLTGYTAAMVVRSALATAAPALLTPTCTFQNAAFSGTISGTTLTLTSATVGTIFTQVTLSTGAVVAGQALAVNGVPQNCTIQTYIGGGTGSGTVGAQYPLSASPSGGNVTAQPMTAYNGTIAITATPAQTAALTALLSNLPSNLVSVPIGYDSLGNPANATGYQAYYALEITDSSGNVTRLLQGTALISPQVV